MTIKKRCQKGKSCGATCISRTKLCRVDLEGIKESIKHTRDSLTSPPKNQSAYRERVQNAINAISDDGNTGRLDVNGEVPANKVNWEAGLMPGARIDAAGGYGVFVDIPPSSLAKGLGERFPNGVGVKYGEVTPKEVELLKLAGESGASPRLIAARIIALGDNRLGAVAMERIPGQTLSKLYNQGKINEDNLSDAFLRGIAKLHMAGISHGDAHLGNVILQPDGKAKFLDLGFSKLDYRDALQEAMGFMNPYFAPFPEFRSGLQGAVSDRMRENYTAIKNDGRMEKYYGPMSDQSRIRLAKEILMDLYKGV